MSPLQQMTQAGSEWDLEAFVQRVNDLLPHYLPASATGNRPPDLVNPRLIRSYTTQGVVDRPRRQGREARYTYRHLLQLLLVRRLLAEGYGTAAIQPITSAKATPDLEALLEGGLQLTVETANPALAFLQSVQARTARPTATASSPSAPLDKPAAQSRARQASAPDATGAISRWQRLEVLPGLEVQVREDFVPPSTPQERDNLLQLIAQTLTPILDRSMP
jgi:DNA-binding transcriptional MerR regulator